MYGKRRFAAGAALSVLMLATAVGHADPVTLRLASIAPEGTEWARLSRSFAREVEHATNGQVLIKWYFGGIAGGETEVIDRMRRGQLDGAASGGMMCQRLAPSMRVMRIVGMLQTIRNRRRPRMRVWVPLNPSSSC